MDGKGYRCTEGPGAGIVVGNIGSGAGYGGNGGQSSTDAEGGSAYGSNVQPIDFGSGGGHTIYGGTGGGAIKLDIAPFNNKIYT